MNQTYTGIQKCTGRRLIALCLALLPALAFAQVSVRLYADSSRVETGNPYVLHFEAPTGSGMPDSMNFEVWSAFIPEGNFIRVGEWRREQGRLLRDMTVLFFDADTLVLPPLYIHLAGGDSAVTNEWQVEVYATPSPDDMNDLAPIKDIHREKTLWTDYLPWLIGILLVVCAIAIVSWLVMRRPKKSTQSRVVEQLPHELAMRRLEQLKQKSWWTSGKVKEHCAELTFILREYFEKRFGVPALESTSDELLKALQKSAFPQEYLTDLKYVLEQADLAKFAKGVPGEEFYAYSFDFAQALVRDTIPEVEESAG